MGSLNYMRFKVMYKTPSMHKARVVDYVFDNLKELMKHLAGEGLTKEAVELLVVHYTPSASDETMELVSIDNTGKHKLSPPNNVVDIRSVKHLSKAKDLVPTKPKPHVKLKLTEDIGAVGQGLYRARRGG